MILSLSLKWHPGDKKRLSEFPKRWLTKNEQGPLACEIPNYSTVLASSSPTKHCVLMLGNQRDEPQDRILWSFLGLYSLCSSSYHIACSPQRIQRQLHPAKSALSGHCACLPVLRHRVPWESTFACLAVGNPTEEQSSQISADGITGSYSREPPCLYSALYKYWKPKTSQKHVGPELYQHSHAIQKSRWIYFQSREI